MNLDELELELTNIKNEIDKINSQLKPLNIKYSELYDKIRLVKLNNLLPLTPEKVLTTDYTVFDSEKGYRELVKFFDSFKFVCKNGYNTHTLKPGIFIKLSQKYCFQQQMDEINKFIPHIVKVKKEGLKLNFNNSKISEYVRIVNIFEFTLSEGGSFWMVLSDDNTATLIRTTYGRSNHIKTLPLEEMIEYIIKNIPYEFKQDEDKQDEDYEDYED